MAPAHSRQVEKMTAKTEQGCWNQPLVFKRPERGDEGKHDKKIKCRTNPNNADSTTYKIPMAYFRDRTPEEWFLFKKKLTRCMTGQNATDGATKYALARQLLAGRALADFNRTATINGNESLANYTRCIQVVTFGVFPRNLFKARNSGWDAFWRNQETCRCETILPESLRSTTILQNSRLPL